MQRYDRREPHAGSIIASKFSVAYAATVVSDDCCHLLFRHCWQCERTANKVSAKNCF